MKYFITQLVKEFYYNYSSSLIRGAEWKGFGFTYFNEISNPPLPSVAVDKPEILTS
jgi:hypothetical protein